MKDLENAVENQVHQGSMANPEDLHKAGKNWAMYCLDTYTDGFLTRGLAISKAIADFTSALKKDAPQE
jgi:hypothetical protein